MIAYFRKIFITGVVVILPLFFTLIIINAILKYVDTLIGPYVLPVLINTGFPLPKNFFLPLISMLATVLIIFTVGLASRNYFGRKIWSYGERLVKYIPGVSMVYGSIKQIIDAFSIDNEKGFKKVVMLEYPRKDTWSIGFVTGDSEGEVQLKTAADLVNVFIPTTPNPTSGYLLFVPRTDLIMLDMSIEDALKMIISGGIITPEYSLGADKHIPAILTYRPSQEMIDGMGKAGNGVIKFVVDLANDSMIGAGAKWHSELKTFMINEGSDPSNLVGAKLFLDKNEIQFRSQINIGHESATLDEVVSPGEQAYITKMAKKFLIE